MIAIPAATITADPMITNLDSAVLANLRLAPVRFSSVCFANGELANGELANGSRMPPPFPSGPVAGVRAAAPVC
jgi:hypothetical protein